MKEKDPKIVGAPK